MRGKSFECKDSAHSPRKNENPGAGVASIDIKARSCWIAVLDTAQCWKDSVLMLRIGKKAIKFSLMVS